MRLENRLARMFTSGSGTGRAERQSRVQRQEDHGHRRGQGEVRHQLSGIITTNIAPAAGRCWPSSWAGRPASGRGSRCGGPAGGRRAAPRPRLRPAGLAEGDSRRRAQDAGHEAEATIASAHTRSESSPSTAPIDGATDQRRDHDLRAAPQQTDHATERDALTGTPRGAEQPPTLPTARRRQWTSFSPVSLGAAPVQARLPGGVRRRAGAAGELPALTCPQSILGWIVMGLLAGASPHRGAVAGPGACTRSSSVSSVLSSAARCDGRHGRRRQRVQLRDPRDRLPRRLPPAARAVRVAEEISHAAAEGIDVAAGRGNNLCSTHRSRW